MRQLQIAILLLATSAPAQAQDRNDIIFQKLYSKLANVLGVSDVDAAGQVDALVLASPGYILDEANVDYNNPNGRRIVFNLIDSSLRPSWILRFSGGKTSDVYSDILTNHTTSVVTMTAQQRDNLTKARAIIFDPKTNSGFSQRYRNFADARRELAAEMEAVQTWQRANPNDSIPATMVARLSDAREKYDLVAEKNVILAAKATIDSLENLDPAVFWGKALDRYQTNQLPVGANFVPIYDFYPAYPTWLDQSVSWTRIKFDDSDVNTVATSSRSNWNAGGSGRWGLWNVGGSYGQSESRSSFELDAQSFSVDFEVLRVKIDRPWMNYAVFGSRTWKWSPASANDKKLISDGNTSESSPPDGIAPLLPVEILIARNVSLTGNWNTSLKTTYSNQRSGGARVGWGPFSFGGGGGSSYDETKERVQISGNTITSPAPQIIGLLVQVLPKSPDPNLTDYEWPDQSPVKVNGIDLSGDALQQYQEEMEDINKLEREVDEVAPQ
ncbi:MAG TPA: hypothetical protein VMN38_02985 [Sphingomicrobium sp.]|nr:hypothetical protein [Sphingomicrobium sp.]